MKTRLVMWGSNEENQKVLIAISLRAEDNVVDIFTFPFETTTEEFYNLMLNEWRESHEVPFPEGFKHITKPLTASDSILPPELKVDRSDIIQRAQTEWHFVVLSNKLYQAFLDELKEIKEKVKSSDLYNNQLWERMKEGWEKIQKHIFNKTLLREHGQELRDMTNDIFTQLKNKRKELDSEVDRVSREVADKLNAKLEEIEGKIQSGLGLQPLFNDLKRLQQEFKDAELSRGDRAKIWKRIDVAFKAVKEKKFGDKNPKDASALNRLNRRLEGLMSAIDKMEKSIRRDDKDKSFQDDRIANTEGQLEAQIRMAKLKMIDERINSKNEKLAEMQKTKIELEERINREVKYLEEQKKQQAMKEELKEAKENVKQKIAESIHSQSDQFDSDALAKAAEAIAEQRAGKSKPKHKESLLGAISETLGESLEDLGDSLSAVAHVVSDKLEDAFQDVKAGVKEKMEKAEDALQEIKKDAKEKFDDIKEGVQHAKEEAKEKSDEVDQNVQDLKEKAVDKTEDLEADTENLKEEVDDKMEEIKKAAQQMISDSKEMFEDMKEGAKHLTEVIRDKVNHLVDEAGEKLDDLKSSFDSEKDEKEEEKKD